MGCITSKNLVVEDSREEGLTRNLTSSSKRATSEMNVLRLSSSKRVEGVWEKDKLLDGVDMKASLLDKNASGSVELYDDDDDQNGKKKMEKPKLTVLNHPGLGRVPKASEGEQVAAGWPTWLSSVAGEAIER